MTTAGPWKLASVTVTALPGSGKTSAASGNVLSAPTRSVWPWQQHARCGSLRTWIAAPLCRYRPWYRQKVAPSQLDVAEACREALHEAGIFPIPRFIPEVAENQEELDNGLPLAA